MIISKLQGGIGNQLFIYAATRSISLKYNMDYVFDTTSYINSNRKIQLDQFGIKINTPYNLKSDNIVINGYWQSEKYFKEHESIIRKDLDFKFNLDIPLKGKKCVSLHVRRGDYLQSNGYHPVQSISYCKDAIDYIGDYDHLLIFSDDIKWCRENLKFKNMYFMNLSEIESLYVMSKCQVNIIANSSFSWWGAYLGENKTVLSPSKWYGDVNIDTNDLLPNNWIVIP